MKTAFSEGIWLVDKRVNEFYVLLMRYPVTKKSEIVDDYHGVEVVDNYRWMENENSSERLEWINEENQLTRGYLDSIPFRDTVKKRLTELWNYPKCGIPTKVGEYYFFFENSGLQNQSVLYYKVGLDGDKEVCLDLNTLSQGGDISISSLSFSKDNRKIAFAFSESGSDWTHIKVMDIATKTYTKDVVRWVKFSGANWSYDSKGFYYSGYDKPTSGSELSAQNQQQRLYYHKLGTSQSDDIIIWEDADNPLRYFSAKEQQQGNYLFINISEGTHGDEIIYSDLKSGNGFKTLFNGFDYDYHIVAVVDDLVYVITNDGAKNHRLAVVNLNNGGDLIDVIPERESVISDVDFVGGHFVVSYLEQAVSALYQYQIDGVLVRKIELPTIGTIVSISGKREEQECFYALTNYTSPVIIYRCDLETGVSEVYASTKVVFDQEQYVTRQIWYHSCDGADVSMFVTHRKNIELDGTNPTYLYGYGGFNISLTPSFNPATILLLESGGVYAVANLRGGGEYGERWHKGGMLEQKQNVFDDFIAAAEYLIKKGYTSSDHLAIAGGSNGGLLVGACMTQRPELFAVALPAVGVLDMLRYHKFTVGWGWVVEYGSSEIKEQFEYLYRYSPLHNIKNGTNYPATLITTADHDDRVVPAHSLKFAARLQEAQSGDNPVLVRIGMDAGHGAGKPTMKIIEEQSDVYSFMLYHTTIFFKMY